MKEVHPKDALVREISSELGKTSPDFVRVADILNDIRGERRSRQEIEKLIEEHFNRIEKELRRQRGEFFNISEEERQKKAFIISLYLVLKDLKASQIMHFLNMLRDIRTKQRRGVSEEEINISIRRIRPMLIYAAAKNRKIEPLLRIVDRILPFLNDKNFEDFYYFIQAIVAYHKFLRGED